MFPPSPAALALAYCCALGLQAQAPSLQPGAGLEARWSAERWQLAAPNQPMDLLGLALHRTWDEGAYLGVGGWGSLRGDFGGFITLGISGGYRWALTERLALEAWCFLGGGGVGRAQVGGGLMVRGEAGLRWDLGPTALGLAWSRVRFPNGRLASSQLALTATVPFRVLLDPPPSSTSSLGWRGVTLAATGQQYTPGHGVRLTSGVLNREAVGLQGVEARMEVKGPLFWVLDLGAANRGQADGYMEALVGLGWNLPLDGAGRWHGLAKVEAGAAGGGKLDVGGGLALKGLVGLEFRSPGGTFAGLNLGAVTTPGGSFKARVLQLGLGRRFDVLSTEGRPRTATEGLASSQWSLWMGGQRLATPQRKGGAAPLPIELVSLRLAHDLSPNFYLAGQANFATTGRAGGYATGLLGLGFRTPRLVDGGPALVLEILGGAAGGGGVDTPGGLLFQPVVGLEQALGGAWSLRLLGGRSLAPRGALHTNVMELSLGTRFGLLVRR